MFASLIVVAAAAAAAPSQEAPRDQNVRQSAPKEGQLEQVPTIPPFNDTHEAQEQAREARAILKSKRVDGKPEAPIAQDERE